MAAVLQKLGCEHRRMVQVFNIIARSYLPLLILQVSWWTLHLSPDKQNITDRWGGGGWTSCKHLKT